MKFIIDVWNGKLALVKTYWLLGVLLGLPFYASIYYLETNFDSLSETGALIGLIFFIFYIIYVVWVNVGVWRSATVYIKNKKIEKRSSFWGYVAKVLTVVGVLRAALELTKGFI